MKLGELTKTELAIRLQRGDLILQTGPFRFRIQSGFTGVIEGVALLYRDHDVLEPSSFSDYHVSVSPARGLRRWYRPQAHFIFDGRKPFMPLPASQALPFLEWGMNWAISNHAHQYLILHAASLERESQAIILPGVPGAGKSTLCAGLVSRGWRLLSDELTLIRLKDGLIDALSRPISLKNASIDIVRGLLGNEDIGPVCTDTGKGTVAHAKPPTASIEAANAMNPVATRPAWIVFPTYVPNAPVQIDEIGRARGFMDLQAQAFNFDLIGGEAFKSLSNLVNQTRLCRVSYGSMDLAFEGLREMTGVRF